MQPILSVEEDIVLSLMQTLVDLAHLPIIVSGGVPFDCLIPCQNLLDVPLLVLSMVSNITLDSYLMNIVKHPCVPGFNNSLDGGDCIKWRTLCDDLAVNLLTTRWV